MGLIKLSPTLITLLCAPLMSTVKKCTELAEPKTLKFFNKKTLFLSQNFKYFVYAYYINMDYFLCIYEKTFNINLYNI